MGGGITEEAAKSLGANKAARLLILPTAKMYFQVYKGPYKHYHDGHLVSIGLFKVSIYCFWWYFISLVPD